MEILVVSPGGSWNPSLPIAGSRAGALGLLDLSYLTDAGHAERAARRLADLSRERFGLVLEGRIGSVERAALAAFDSCDTVLLTPETATVLEEAVAAARTVAHRVGLVCHDGEHATWATANGVDFVVAKGHEAGGRIGSETTFVLLQRLLNWDRLPVFAWGGIGLHTAAACQAAGASGIVLDWQLALTRESPIPARFQRLIAAMDGSETAVVDGPDGTPFRVFSRPGMTAEQALRASSNQGRPAGEARLPAWDRAIRSLMSASRIEERLWPVGQDAAFASACSAGAPSVSRVLATLRSSVADHLKTSGEEPPLAPGSPLARSHGTEYPIVQGPMTRVSDVPGFCASVAREGGLPFLALALMRGPQVRALLKDTRAALGERPWGVGILGFVDGALRAEQTEEIKAFRPPYALIAGGRPDQAAALEEMGVHTYLHVPSPEILRLFLRQGARRFVFEGSECGGHVGPRTSFVLWDTMVRILLDARLSREEAEKVHVLFAGGIHDSLSSSMVCGVAQALVTQGMKVGVVLGSAYLFTEEILQTGAVTAAFQKTVLDADKTVLLESGPGHAIRCAETQYALDFHSRKEVLQQERRSQGQVREELERMNMGRLRLASKGLMRDTDTPSDERPLVSVAESEQRRLGMYMMGQIAALRRDTCTIRSLHREVSEGPKQRLAALRELARVVAEPPRAIPVAAPLDVAIVGMACLLPGAGDLKTFWNNILNKHDATREIPPDRFDSRRWFDVDRTARDKIYSKWGGFLEDVPFDPLKHRIPPAALASIEPMQLLALEVVDRALRDAGCAESNPYRSRTSVILGAGGGLSELGGSYTFRSSVPQYIANPDDSLWDQLPEWTEESFPGILLNVVAGRIANRFDFGGVNYIVDAACASSLAAIYQACSELANGTSDMVISGGCDTVQNPAGYLCFAKTGALSPRDHARPFDASADGIVISEGLAVVVLKRREDAERDGDRIYALIRGVAGGSDGCSKSLTAPHGPGQAEVLERAYLQAGFSPSSVGLFEAHGTGTALGDRTEFAALASVLSRHGAAPRSVALGSVKSMIGHTKCAAGVAGLIKAALALHHRVLPPTLHVETPLAEARREGCPLYLNAAVRPWVRGADPRRAGVSGFGFGGSNFHAVLEEYRDDARLRAPATPDRQRPVELFVFRGPSREALAAAVLELHRELARVADSGVRVCLPDLAISAHQRRRSSRDSHRAACVAGSLTELQGQLDTLLAKLTSRAPQDEKLAAGAYYSDSPPSEASELAFLFPGQGSQYPNMMLDLAVEFAEVRECCELADDTLRDVFDRPLSRFVFPPPPFGDEDKARAFDELKATNVAQPALGACDLAVFRLLEAFGVAPSMLAGHSYGELVALHAAGSLSARDLLKLSSARGSAMLTARGDSADADLGQMVAVAADETTVRETIGGCEAVWLANLNAPRQTVISGSRSGIADALRALKAAGLSTSMLPVACAFHSPLMSRARERYADALSGVEIRHPRLAVFCNVTADRAPDDPERIRALLAEQVVSRVRFAEQIQAMYEAGGRVFVEVGPGAVLSGLVRQILAGRPHAAVATQPNRGHGLTDFLHALAALSVQGLDVDLERLFEGRGLSRIELGGSTSPERSAAGSHQWLVNGSYARPASEPPRTARPQAVLTNGREASGNGPGDRRPRTEVAVSPSAPGAPPAPSPSSASTPHDAGLSNRASGPGAEAEVHQEFQGLMRKFLRTQDSVMQAFLLGGNGDSDPATREPRPRDPARATGDDASQTPRWERDARPSGARPGAPAPPGSGGDSTRRP